MQLFALFVCTSLLHVQVNEAVAAKSGASLSLAAQFRMSKAHLKASMTLQHAVRVAEKSAHVPHDVLALIQENLGHKHHRSHHKHHRSRKSLRKDASLLQSAAAGQTGPPGAQGNSQSVYNGGVWSALYKINDMLLETVEKADLEAIRCDSYKRTEEVLMEEIKEDLALYIVLVTSATADKNDAETQIQKHSEAGDKIEADIVTFTAEMDTELASLDSQLKVAKGDSDVMEKILNMTECSDASTNPTLIQTQADLLQCVNTETGRSFTKLHIKNPQMVEQFSHMKHPKIMSLLREAGINVDEVDTSLVQKQRSTPCGCSCHDDPAYEVMYGADQKDNACNIRDSEKFKFLDDCCIKGTNDVAACCALPTLSPEQEASGGAARVATSDQADEALKAEKCSLRDSNKCPELRERFLNIAGGIDDTITQLTHLIANTESRKEHGLTIMRAELSYHKEVGDSETAKLARAMATLTTVQEQQRMKTALLKQTEQEYAEEVYKCKTYLEELTNEECALGRIRGELLNMDTLPNNITDCLTSQWSPEECSLTCGGGTQVLRRTIEIETDLGYNCPALTAKQSCNEQRCPLDCELADWTGWSACSAYCDGGVMDRIRPVTQHPTSGGQPCGTTDDSQDCNVQSCDKDCVLYDWTEWTASCTKVCGGGRQMRFKHIKEHEYGEMGTCPTFHDAKRFQWKLCNTHECAYDDRYPLTCEAKLDVVIAIDDSGSMGDAGWTAAKTAAANVASSMGTGTKIAALSFSSPASYYELKWCMGWWTPWWWNSWYKPSSSDCGSRWISHLSEDSADVKTKIDGWTAKFYGTLTNIAIDKAGVEFGNHGRSYATSVLIVFTDGYPESRERTAESSSKFQNQGRVLYVPVGSFANDDYFHQIASYPWQDNLVAVQDFQALAARNTLDRLLPQFCPNIVQDIPADAQNA